METLNDITGKLEHALRLHRMTLRLVPLRGKAPFQKEWQFLHLSEEDIRLLSAEGVNWGVITGELLLVIDTDSDEAEAWVKEKGIDSNVIVRSGGGGRHYYFRIPEGVELHSKSNLHGVPGLDLKAWNSCIVAAGSIHPDTGKTYAYVPGKELTDIHALPLFDVNWLKVPRKKQACRLRSHPLPAVPSRNGTEISDIRAYIRRIPSVQGCHGSNAAYRVAALLLEAGFSAVETLQEMEAWNEVCAFPLWSRAELIHKIESVLRNKARGLS